MWIGVHTELGKGVYCPLPAYLDLQPNGTYRFGLIDESAPARTTTWAITGDTLRLFDLFYAPGLVTLQADTLRIGVAYPMTFQRFKDVSVDSATVQKTLVNRIWQTDSLTVHFHDNGRVCLENRTTQQRTVHYWRLSRRGQSVFVVMQGSQHKTGGAYKPLWQITLPEESGATMAAPFRTTRWNGQRVVTETVKLVRALLPGDSCRATGFQTCDNCFFPKVIYGPPSASQQYVVRKIVGRLYQSLDQAGESGLVQIRFVVNCAGETGLFTVTEMDENYRPRPFNPQIIHQLTTICQNHLIRALTDEASKLVDQPDRAFTLNFRLKDGHLTDIFP